MTEKRLFQQPANTGQSVMQKDFHYYIIYALAKEAGKG